MTSKIDLSPLPFAHAPLTPGEKAASARAAAEAKAAKTSKPASNQTAAKQPLQISISVKAAIKALATGKLNGNVLSDKEKDGLDAITKIKSMRINVNDDRKALAKAKIGFIKLQIQAMAKLHPDPKTAAREAARLAKELAAAVKEYAEAASSSAADPTVGQAPADAPAQTEAKDKDAADPKNGSSDADKHSDDKPTADNPKAEFGAEAATASDPEKSKTQSTTITPTAKELRAEDREFIREFRDLEREIKKIANGALLKLKESKKEDEKLIKELKKGLKELDKQITDAARALKVDQPVADATPAMGTPAEHQIDPNIAQVPTAEADAPHPPIEAEPSPPTPAQTTAPTQAGATLNLSA